MRVLYNASRYKIVYKSFGFTLTAYVYGESFDDAVEAFRESRGVDNVVISVESGDEL